MKFDVFDALDKLNKHFSKYDPTIKIFNGELGGKAYQITIRVNDTLIGMVRQLHPFSEESTMHCLSNLQFRDDIEALKRQVKKVLSE